MQIATIAPPARFFQGQLFAEFHQPVAPQGVALTPDVESMIARDCVVAVGVSGGKDSVACALAVDEYLRRSGHRGPRVLVHADLGRVEWRDSLPSCERLAKRIGWELLVVRRQAGDMLARWQGRWANNVARYSDLSCVKLMPSRGEAELIASVRRRVATAVGLHVRYTDADKVMGRYEELLMAKTQKDLAHLDRGWGEQSETP